MISKKSLLLPILLLLIFLMISTPVHASQGENKNLVTESVERHWNNDNLVVTNNGVLEGTETKNTFKWLGVPYAKPPVGNLRWKAPRDHENWKGIKRATEYGSPSVQYAGIMAIDNEEKILEGDIIGNENCLTLNVWRPNTSEDNLPVYVFVHGGSNQVGWSGFPLYNGANLADKGNCVVVTINYRVGISGWFYNPSLDYDTSLDNSGNYGLLDVVKAFEWVHKNIDSFGGNPNKITVSGESAGAMNIYQILCSPYVKENYFEKGVELFQRAVLESGMMLPTPMDTAKNSSHQLLVKLLIKKGRAIDENDAEKAIKNMSEDDIAELLRNTSMENIYKCYEPTPVNAHISYGMGNYNDGYVIDDPYQRLIRGNYIKVPLIIGSNAEEGKLFLSMTVGENFSKGSAFENAMFGKPHPKTLSSYLNPKFWGAFPEASKLVTITGFQTAGVEIPASLMKHHQNSVYVYKFAWDEEPEPFNYLIGACHASEIPFIFGNTRENAFPFNHIAWTENNKLGRQSLSNTIIEYWKKFMENGNPNTPDQPKWRTWSNWPWSSRTLVLDSDQYTTKIRMVNTFVNEDSYLTSSENYLDEQMVLENLKSLNKSRAYKGILKKATGFFGGEDSEMSFLSKKTIIRKSGFLAWFVILFGTIVGLVVYLFSGRS